MCSISVIYSPIQTISERKRSHIPVNYRSFLLSGIRSASENWNLVTGIFIFVHRSFVFSLLVIRQIFVGATFFIDLLFKR